MTVPVGIGNRILTWPVAELIGVTWPAASVSVILRGRRHVGSVEINIPIGGALGSDGGTDSVKCDWAALRDGDGTQGVTSGIFDGSRNYSDILGVVLVLVGVVLVGTTAGAL